MRALSIRRSVPNAGRHLPPICHLRRRFSVIKVSHDALIQITPTVLKVINTVPPNARFNFDEQLLDPFSIAQFNHLL